MQEFNQDSISFSINGEPLTKNKITTKEKEVINSSKYLDDLIDNIDHQLVRCIQIVTPIQLRSFNYRKQLQNYRFQRKQRSQNLFNNPHGSQQREYQQLFATFRDVFSEWRNGINKKFYIVLNNGDLMYFFHKPEDKQKIKKCGSYVIISCKKSSYSLILNQNKINFEMLEKTEFQNERIIIKDNSIHLFWRYLVNNCIQKPIYYEFIANFHFLNSFQILAIEEYNGKEQKVELNYLAEKKINIIGQVETQLYVMKLLGFWLKQNCKKLRQSIQQDEQLIGKQYLLQIQFHSATKNFKEQVQKL